MRLDLERRILRIYWLGALYFSMFLVVTLAGVALFWGPYDHFANSLITGVLIAIAYFALRKAKALSRRTRRQRTVASDGKFGRTSFRPVLELCVSSRVSVETHVICPIAYHIGRQGDLTLNAWCFNLNQSRLYRAG